jgi:hypothetical protein
MCPVNLIVQLRFRYTPFLCSDMKLAEIMSNAQIAVLWCYAASFTLHQTSVVGDITATCFNTNAVLSDLM